MTEHKYKILMVDDEPDNLALLYRTLRNKYDIEKSTSPVAALDILKNGNFDLILSDHKMPEMDGVEFLKRCYEISPDTMRLMVTAYTDAGILIDAINSAKIYRYVKKPYNPDELMLTVQNALEFYQLKQDNGNLINDLKELFSGTVEAIVEALEAKDPYTMGKSKRVTFYSVKLAQAMKLNEKLVGKIELAGLLHDIGMLAVPDNILYKVDKLTPEEYNEIKKHVGYSVRILSDINQLKDIIDIIRYHHEHYNGGGYPYGKKEQEIPLASKIIAIADAFDSMTTPKVYRKQIGPQEAMNIIKSLAGRQFDPIVVRHFDAVMPELYKNVNEAV